MWPSQAETCYVASLLYFQGLHWIEDGCSGDSEVLSILSAAPVFNAVSLCGFIQWEKTKQLETTELPNKLQLYRSDCLQILSVWLQAQIDFLS